MKALLISAALFACQPAYAGGPVITTEETTEVAPDHDRKNGWIVPVVVGLVLLCAIACGGDDEPGLAPCKNTTDGCS